DEDVFTDPFSFDILRDPNPHVTFGGQGPHYCIGANLARMQLELIFNAIADHMPDLTALGDPTRLRSGWLHGLTEWKVDLGTCPVSGPPRARGPRAAALRVAQRPHRMEGRPGHLPGRALITAPAGARPHTRPQTQAVAAEVIVATPAAAASACGCGDCACLRRVRAFGASALPR